MDRHHVGRRMTELREKGVIEFVSGTKIYVWTEQTKKESKDKYDIELSPFFSYDQLPDKIKKDISLGLMKRAVEPFFRMIELRMKQSDSFITHAQIKEIIPKRQLRSLVTLSRKGYIREVEEGFELSIENDIPEMQRKAGIVIEKEVSSTRPSEKKVKEEEIPEAYSEEAWETYKRGKKQLGGVFALSPESLRELRSRIRNPKAYYQEYIRRFNLTKEDIREKIKGYDPSKEFYDALPILLSTWAQAAPEYKEEIESFLREELKWLYFRDSEECRKHVEEDVKEKIKEIHWVEAEKLWNEIKADAEKHLKLLNKFTYEQGITSFQKDVLKVVVARGANCFSPSDIAKLTNISERTIRDTLSELVGRGVLTRPGGLEDLPLKGRYLLSEDFIKKLHKYKPGIIDKHRRDDLIWDIKRERIYDEFERDRG
ncbi:MAG: hypothetical protein KAU03_06915, partial [Candidatus Altiarchaeales archaeon]|nr:hypothetical protein [Candidatus Altiarchaeales archaeon]